MNQMQAIEQWDETMIRRHVVNPVNNIVSRLSKKSITGMLDIGSNVGKVYDVLCENIQIDRCWMIEANPDLARYSQSKYSSNPSVTVINMAVGSVDCLAKFHTNSIYASRGAEYNMGLGCVRNDGDVVIPMMKPSSFIDEEMFSTVQVIKIDTENMDLQILSDLLTVIDKFKTKPVIEFEANWIGSVVSKHHTVCFPHQVFAGYQDRGYVVPDCVDTLRGDSILYPERSE